MKSQDQSSTAVNLLDHLAILRKCLIQIILMLAVVFLCLLSFAQTLYQIFAQPLLQALPANSQMIATDITATFTAPFKLTLFIAFLLCLPFLLWCIWRFIAPALYLQEKKLIIALFSSSLVLFYLGISFSRYIVLPSVLYFFMHIAPDAVLPMTDISSYLGFCLKLFFTFGLCFEIPVLIIVLLLSNLVTLEQLIEKRKFIIVGCFFISMFITPPDLLSMLLLAVPMWGLFEIGLCAGKFLPNQSQHSAE
ncbi:twin-arginine translocase subunit TatC [Acinetobacter sp. Marseille-Q1618]|uniref:twin-arginine translocase subunit TatC n=1 Tax=Acinetobacter sp. Marseille-Q1618 TaxID=2697502 RepID=UPI00156FA42A|nr:twin-arginine translocase subunit TatC [Acinetobacter sp. Marseille-Q1618]